MRRWPQDRSVRNQRKIINPTCINCNAQGHMASSTECPLFPKPRKGTTGPAQPEVGAVLRSSLKDRFPIFMFPPLPLTGVEATLVALTLRSGTFLGCLYLCPTKSKLQKLGSRPRRYGTDSASTLDYALIKNLIWPCTADSIPELSSDHNPSDFTFKNFQFCYPPSPTKYYLEHLH
ncbi:hypothetical protein TNCV_3058561 [Trichonephila clavipes]|nr:hypothetical protein TNCV_3058561 [Trichonephila clavipes]